MNNILSFINLELRQHEIKKSSYLAFKHLQYCKQFIHAYVFLMFYLIIINQNVNSIFHYFYLVTQIEL